MFTGLVRSSLRKTLRKYRVNPRPRTAARAADLMLKLGRGDDALRLLKDAKRRFPDSQLPAAAYIRARRKQAKQALKKTKLLIKQEPTLDLFIRASELHRTLGEFERAMGFLEKASKLFDEHWAIHLTLGKLYFARYRAQKNPADAQDATEHLSHAVTLNPHGYPVLLHNAIVNSHLGNFEVAHESVETILRNFPEDARALSLRSHLDKSRVAASAEKQVVESGIEAAPAVSPPATRPEPNEVTIDGSAEDVFQDLAAEECVVGVFGIASDGAIDFSATKPSSVFEFEDAEDTVRAVAAECRYNASSLGIGDLQSCHLVGDSWEIYLRTYSSKHYACFAEKQEGQPTLSCVVEDAIQAPAIA